MRFLPAKSRPISKTADVRLVGIGQHRRCGQWTDTDLKSALVGMHPIGRLGEAKEVAEVVCFLLSNKASFVSGSQIVVDGGYLSV